MNGDLGETAGRRVPSNVLQLFWPSMARATHREAAGDRTTHPSMAPTLRKLDWRRHVADAPQTSIAKAMSVVAAVVPKQQRAVVGSSAEGRSQ